MTHEQLVHDRINLVRLVRRLEKAVAEERWEPQQTSEDAQRTNTGNPYMIWIKAQGTLQKLKYARSLLKLVELEEDIGNVQIDYGSLRETLNRLEEVVKEANERITPSPRRFPPMLPKMPQPIYADTAESVSTKEPGSAAEATVSPVEDAVPPAESLKDLLLSSSDIPPPQVAVPSAATDTPTRRALQSSSAVHEELSVQLAQMATQLKRNALHFSESLVKDQSVVEEAQEKLEKNYGFMKTERTRLRDHGGKSSSTTWLTMGSMVMVAVAFVVMFFIIRLT